MEYIIYVLAGLSVLLALGGLSSWASTGRPVLFLSSVVSIGFSVVAIVEIAWWPLVVGFLLNWFLQLVERKS